MANKRRIKVPDDSLNPEQLASLRQQLGRMSLTALYDAYYAAWIRCKVERDGPAPRPRFVQELVQTWRVLRKLG